MHASESKTTTYTIAFYNLENLFDIHKDTSKNDSDFLPGTEKRWTKKRYDQKLRNLGEVISKIGFDSNQKPPVIIGLAEVENKNVLNDLIQSHYLKSFDYGIIHYNSQDERGIDVGMIYDTSVFTVQDSKTYAVYLKNEFGNQDYTRDILVVTGMLHSEKIYCIVNHWPSRREGEKESMPKRVKAAEKVVDIVNSIRLKDEQAKILVMGDFNDNPGNESVKFLKKKARLFNLMEPLLSYSRGSSNHNFRWNLFDQILLTTNFFETQKNKLKYDRADIYDSKFLTQTTGKYRGQPFRTYSGRKYTGGYSDHFPVYIQLNVSSD
ncbi:MAG: endonuclease/exonuclease/phosphatase family protein [Psychroserpens sp.]|uniref:endonuclease/exonuclease/phosphatase family protein n=1 Tax=Psychroserpens sp. TaxID=2020870 RepID=UPI003CA24EB6